MTVQGPRKPFFSNAFLCSSRACNPSQLSRSVLASNSSIPHQSRNRPLAFACSLRPTLSTCLLAKRRSSKYTDLSGKRCYRKSRSKKRKLLCGTSRVCTTTHMLLNKSRGIILSAEQLPITPDVVAKQFVIQLDLRIKVKVVALYIG